MAATAKVMDFTNVKDRSDVNARRVKATDYRAKIVSVSDAPIKKGANAGQNQWRFVIELQYSGPSAIYAFYCQLSDDMAWKIRNLCLAAGITVPKKRVKVDPNRLVGKFIGVTMMDTEYEGRPQSSIENVFPASEVDNSSDSDEDEDPEDEGTEDDEDDEDEAPAQKAKRSRSQSDDEVTEDDLEELDIDDI